jgi:tetratricopeptide (TPR) repeat protein
MPPIKFILLDNTANTDATIEIIKAIGNTWPLLLTITGIVFLIVYRKGIGAFLSSFKKISGKTPIGEVTLETVAIVNATAEESVAPKIGAYTNQEVDKFIEDKKNENEENTWQKLHDSLRNKNIAEAESIFEKIQVAEKDSNEREHNTLILLCLKYAYAGIDTLDELKEKATKTTSNLVKYHCYDLLALCYSSVKKYDESLVYREKAYAVAPNEDQRAIQAKYTSTSLYELGKKAEAVNFLKKINQEISADANKTVIYRALADLYERDENWVLKSVANEMALNCSPKDESLMFDTAFAYTNTDKNTSEQIPSLALLHYNELIGSDPNSQAAYNNMGVALSAFELEGLAAEKYKKAADLGNTLAVSNLSSRYINAGFYQEAKQILLKAKESADIHENVWTALDSLSRKEKEEAEKYAEILAQAKEEQKFIKRFGDAFFDAPAQPFVSGNWLCESAPVEIKQLPNPIYSELKWTARDLIFTIAIPTDQSSVISVSGSCLPKGGSFSKNILAFVTATPDQRTKLLLVFTLTEPRKSYLFSFINSKD